MVRVVVVGCGEPKKAMGWYHLTQLLEDPRAHVDAVVEQWYLGGGAGTAGCEAFEAFRREACATQPELKFYARIEDLPSLRRDGGRPSAEPVLALIAGRTRDALASFTAVCEKGVTHVLLEKPGGETAGQLEAICNVAAQHGVQAVVGYNKNVSAYVQDALRELRGSEAAGKAGTKEDIILESNNTFTPDSKELLAFIQGPGEEGMIHNMCCHELALAVKFFGLRCDQIAVVTLDPHESKPLSREDGRRDWSRVGFTVTLRSEAEGRVACSSNQARVRFRMDRCGGNFSCVHAAGQSFRLPNGEHAKWVEKAQVVDPEIRPYFLLQSPDYRQLKGMFLDHIAAGLPGTPGSLIDLLEALEVLKLADLLSGALWEAWDAGDPWRWAPDGGSEAAKRRKV